MVPRRAFIGSMATALLAAPRVAVGQPPTKRVGFIANAPSTPRTEPWWDAFRTGLREHGWTENKNVVFERRYAEQRPEAALAVAEELVRLKVDVIVVSSTLTALAARQATTTIPIVATVPADPVATGLVSSLARPGGNVTGLSFVGTELAGKQVELLKEAIPELTRIGVLANPTNASHQPRTREIAEVARMLKLQSDVLEVKTPREIRTALETMARRRPAAAIVLNDPMFFREAATIVRLAADQRLPLMYGLREAVVAGGLMAYGASFGDLFRRAATYVDKILRGAHPSELPVEQASKFELVVNLKTAKALGLALPESVLVRADELIQ